MAEIEEKIKHYIVLYRAKEFTEDQVVEKILAIPEILLKDPKQEPPIFYTHKLIALRESMIENSDGKRTINTHAFGHKVVKMVQQDMLKDKWVKCYPKEANQ